MHTQCRPQIPIQIHAGTATACGHRGEEFEITVGACPSTRAAKTSATRAGAFLQIRVLQVLVAVADGVLGVAPDTGANGRALGAAIVAVAMAMQDMPRREEA
jgi:hypothetical protein